MENSFAASVGRWKRSGHPDDFKEVTTYLQKRLQGTFRQAGQNGDDKALFLAYTKKVWYLRDELNPEKHHYGYFKAIAKNFLIDHLRKQGRRVELVFLDDLPEYELGRLNVRLARTLHAQLRRKEFATDLLTVLTPDERRFIEIVVMQVDGKVTYEEAAELFDCTAADVKNSRAAILLKLRKAAGIPDEEYKEA